MPQTRNRVLWRALWLSVVTVVPIIAGSILLIQFRNSDRMPSHAIMWALDDLAAVPAEISTPVFAPQRYAIAVQRFRKEIEGNALPVDSVREFFQSYSRHARDGGIDADDLRALAPYFGLIPKSAPEVPESFVPDADTTLEDSPELLDEGL